MDCLWLTSFGRLSQLLTDHPGHLLNYTNIRIARRKLRGGKIVCFGCLPEEIKRKRPNENPKRIGWVCAHSCPHRDKLGYWYSFFSRLDQAVKVLEKLPLPSSFPGYSYLVLFIYESRPKRQTSSYLVEGQHASRPWWVQLNTFLSRILPLVG
jgi:hypothetical protein